MPSKTFREERLRLITERILPESTIAQGANLLYEILYSLLHLCQVNISQILVYTFGEQIRTRINDNKRESYVLQNLPRRAPEVNH
jgi:hypothetical protein